MSTIIRPYRASPALEDFILRIAPPHVARWSTAPETYQNMCDTRRTKNIFVVSKRHCERTIFSSREVNYAMRAWHDHIHYAYQLDFSFYSELAVADIMDAHLGLTEDKEGFVEENLRLGLTKVPPPPSLDKNDRLAVWFDTSGQTHAHLFTGGFPRDQALYVGCCFAAGGDFRAAVDIYREAGGEFYS